MNRMRMLQTKTGKLDQLRVAACPWELASVAHCEIQSMQGVVPSFYQAVVDIAKKNKDTLHTLSLPTAPIRPDQDWRSVSTCMSTCFGWNGAVFRQWLQDPHRPSARLQALSAMFMVK